MDAETFEDFCAFIYAESGITLKEGKQSLVSARIAKRMRATGCAVPRDYLDFVRQDETGHELVHMLDAISTNLTSFFRESTHFDDLREALNEWRAKGQLRFRLWCAAASTGEEPYSIAMTVVDTLGEDASDTRILVTDISTHVLAQCREGRYAEDRLDTVTPVFKGRYFDRCADAAGTCYTVKNALRAIMTFKRLNLSAPPFPLRGPLDAVFCRNVMIYFDPRVRKRLIDEVYRLLKPGGYLIVGHSESLNSIPSHFKRVKPAVYRKPGR